tara:strand:+ start:239 stop:400 length:162 start_codon:yes stop_codon:yes gene_type:complete
MKTIKIENSKSKSGYSVINECDFIEGENVRFKEKAETKTKAKAKTTTTKSVVK